MLFCCIYMQFCCKRFIERVGIMYENTNASELTLLSLSTHDSSGKYSCEPITRDCYIIHLVKEGKGIFKCNGKVYEVSAGQMFFIFPDTLVEYYPNEASPWKYCWIDFVGTETLQLISYTLFGLNNPVTPLCDKKIRDIFFELCLTNGASSTSEISVCIKAKGLFYLLMSELAAAFPSEHKSRYSADLPTLAAEFIRNNYYNSDMSVEGIADSFSVNRISLYRAFKKKLNISPAQFIIKLRIERACNILSNTSLSIKTVAYSVGYNDPLYFSKIFSSNIGMSPSEYRKRNTRII